MRTLCGKGMGNMKSIRYGIGAWLLAGLLLGVLGGCEEECAPGDTQACICDDGRTGVHVCRPDGDGWTECNCLGQ